MKFNQENTVKKGLFELDEVKWYWLAGVLMVVVWLVFGRAVFNGFVWDDIRLIEENTDLADWSRVGELFAGRTLFFNDGSMEKYHHYYKPLLGLWWMVNYAVFGGANSAGFHGALVMLHGVVGVVVMGCLKAVFEKAEFDKPKTLAFWVSLLWLVHAANTESVVYVAAGQEPLFMLWVMLGLWLVVERERVSVWVRDKLKLSEKGSERLVKVWLGMGLLVGLLFKEMAIVLVPLVIGYEWWLGDRGRIKGWLVATAVGFGIYSLMRFGWVGIGLAEKSQSIPIHRASLGERLLTVPYVLREHFRLMVVPVQLSIGDSVVIKSISAKWWGFVASVLIGLVALGILGWKNKVSRFAVVMTLVGLLPVSQLLALDMTHSSRWLYFSLLWLVVVVVVWLWQLRWKGARYVLIVLVLVMAGRAFSWAGVWKDQESVMAASAVFEEKEPYQVWINLAVEKGEHGDLEEEKYWLEKTVAVNPYVASAWVNLGVNAQESGKLEVAEEYYWKAIELSRPVNAYINLSILLGEQQDSRVFEVVSEGLQYYPGQPTLVAISERLLQQEN